MAALLQIYKKYKKAVHGAGVIILPWAAIVVASKEPGITANEWLLLGGSVFGVGTVVAGTTNEPQAG